MSVLEARFDDPVLGAQSIFRAVMEALAHPGTPHPIAFSGAPPAPLTPELAAVVLTLCDHDTPIWLDPALAGSADVGEWIGFHTGAPIERDTARAAFALATDGDLLPPLATFAQGTDEYPDRSTTVMLAVPALAGGAALRARGPGIANDVMLAPQGLPHHFATERAENRDRFPRGVDLLLTAPGMVLGLPRSTRLEV